MCTAISYHSNNQHFFGRNLDLEHTYQEQVVITPRNYPFSFRCGLTLAQHYAMIGMATVSDGYPLYYEATNECGLSIAGLNFPDNAVYHAKTKDKDNIAPYELIPWVLGRCKDVTEASELLQKINLWELPFSRAFPLSALHWLISDPSESLVLEPMWDGIRIFSNPSGVLTNNPPFPYHLCHLQSYCNLSRKQPQTLAPTAAYSNGMGAVGLPGDFSSASRFVRASFVKENSVQIGEPVTHYFHLLASTAMPGGSVELPNGTYEITQYSSCCDTLQGIYYYTTYQNSRVTAVKMHNYPLDGAQLRAFPLRKKADILFEN